MKPSYDSRRRVMVDRDLIDRGIRDERVLAAMGSVPREHFVPADSVRFAYDDGPLSIGWRQTISQPYIVAVALEALEIDRGDRVLDVGTGSGYTAAVLSLMAVHVTSIERVAELAASAAARLKSLGYDNVDAVCGDGSLGWADAAPYDTVCVSAAGPRVPTLLVEQLREGGRLVMPVEGDKGQVLVVGVRRGDDLILREIADVRFVPLLGVEGYATPVDPDGD